MPKSIDPEPADNEIECARCGAYFYYELTRCPNCGVSVYDPEPDSEPVSQTRGILEAVRAALRRLLRKPYSAEEVFGASLDQAILYNDLLEKVAGDRPTADRLIEFERQRAPRATRLHWIRNAIQRWEKDNQRFGPLV